MSEIKKLSELDEKQADESIRIFVDGLFAQFAAISKDKEKLHKLFKKSLDYDMTYAFLQDGEALGFLGLGDYQKRPIKLDEEAFMEIKGGFAGKVAFGAMSAAMEKPNLSSPREICIEYLATNPVHRSKGIGSKLIEFVRNIPGCERIELEVFSKNPRAIKFYEREGFKVVSAKTDLAMMLQGSGKRIIMRYGQPVNSPLNHIR